MGLKRRTKRHHNNTPICFAHLSGCSTNHLGLGLGLGLWVPPGREIKKQFLNFGNQNRPNKLRNAVHIYKNHYSSAAASILAY